MQNLVYRYNTAESDDGVGGEEGTFCLCTLWSVGCKLCERHAITALHPQVHRSSDPCGRIRQGRPSEVNQNVRSA
jgi:hypothetical protein